MTTDVVRVLDFWFGSLNDSDAFDSGLLDRWFSVDSALDQMIREQFGTLVEAVAAGRCQEWQATADGALASIVVLDQFSRNIYRDRARMFEFDALAYEIAQQSLDAGLDCLVHPVQSAFFYMPFEHAEDLATQEHAVTLFRMLQRRVAEPYRDQYAAFVDLALAHRDIVARFGRFPNRNKTLGRESTTAEAHFLELEGSAF